MAIAAGFLSSRLNRSQLPVPKFMIIDTFKGKVTYSYSNPPATLGGSGGAVVATSLTQVSTGIEVIVAAEAAAGPQPEPTPPPPVADTFDNITDEFGAITKTFGEL